MCACMVCVCVRECVIVVCLTCANAQHAINVYKFLWGMGKTKIQIRTIERQIMVLEGQKSLVIEVHVFQRNSYIVSRF